MYRGLAPVHSAVVRQLTASEASVQPVATTRATTDREWSAARAQTAQQLIMALFEHAAASARAKFAPEGSCERRAALEEQRALEVAIAALERSLSLSNNDGG